jgi:hypothetical protein
MEDDQMRISAGLLHWWVCIECGHESKLEVEKPMAYLNSSEGKKKAKQLKQLHNRVAEVLR